MSRAAVLCVLLCITSLVAEAKNNLRPFAARHRQNAKPAPEPASLVEPAALVDKKPIVTSVGAGLTRLGSSSPPRPVATAVPAPVTAVAPVAPVASIPPVAAVPAAVSTVVYENLEPTVAPVQQSPQPAALKQLGDDLVEVKQMHANVVQVEQTLAADVSLLRESAKLQRMSTSPRGRAAAQRQVKQIEKLVKDTEAMVVRSRETAVERAREALLEATEVQKAANALSNEARAQLKLMRSNAKTAAAPPPPQPATLAETDEESTPPEEDDAQ